VVRADGLECSIARYLRDRIERDSKIEVLLGHQVRELRNDGHLRATYH
jgi:thioredoxin reductase